MRSSAGGLDGLVQASLRRRQAARAVVGTLVAGSARVRALAPARLGGGAALAPGATLLEPDPGIRRQEVPRMRCAVVPASGPPEVPPPAERLVPRA